MIVIFVQQTRECRYQTFHSTKPGLRTVRMPFDFRVAVVFATSTSGRFCKMKNLWELNLVTISESEFNKTIIPFALVGYEMIRANAALRASLAIYPLI